jgi:hypothetical protein
MIELRENDFKYVLQDISHIYIGARMNYEEVGEHYDTPARLKSAIYRVIIDDVDLETPICEHLLKLEPKTKSYLVYQQLAVKIKIGFLNQKTDNKGVKREEYVTKIYTIQQLAEDNFLREHPNEYVIQELSFHKRKLMSLAV